MGPGRFSFCCINVLSVQPQALKSKSSALTYYFLENNSSVKTSKATCCQLSIYFPSKQLMKMSILIKHWALTYTFSALGQNFSVLYTESLLCTCYVTKMELKNLQVNLLILLHLILYLLCCVAM